MAEKTSSSYSDLQVLMKAERYLSSLRPFLQTEGSTLATRDFKDGVLSIVVSGACVGCALSGTDFSQFASELKEDIPEVKKVLFINPQGLPVA
jgi:Fe-S cluster biogenesis protein NfuA